MREKFESKKQTLERLLLLAESAESEVSPANLARIRAKMSELTTAWERMESAMITSSKSELAGVVYTCNKVLAKCCLFLNCTWSGQECLYYKNA